MLDTAGPISSAFKGDKKSGELKALAVLEYVFYGSSRELALVSEETCGKIGGSTVDELAQKVSGIEPAWEAQKEGVDGGGRNVACGGRSGRFT